MSYQGHGAGDEAGVECIDLEGVVTLRVMTDNFYLWEMVGGDGTRVIQVTELLGPTSRDPGKLMPYDHEGGVREPTSYTVILWDSEASGVDDTDLARTVEELRANAHDSAMRDTLCRRVYEILSMEFKDDTYN